MGRTGVASLDKDGQPQWQRGLDSFLLPLPQVTVAHKESFNISSNPMIDGAAEDSELRLEVWTQGPIATSGHCLGQVLLEGSDLLRQCYKDGDKRSKRTTAFRLAPHKPTAALAKLLSGRSNKCISEAQVSLKIMLFLLHPQCNLTDKSTEPQEEEKYSQEDVNSKACHEATMVKKVSRVPIETELCSILTRIERNVADERRDGIARLAELALSDADEITDIFLSQGAAPVLVKLLTDRSSPIDRRDGVAAIRGLFRNGNTMSRQKLLSAGIFPHLLRLVATADPNLGDASHEGFCALAELLDRGNSTQEIKMLAGDIRKCTIEAEDCNSCAKVLANISSVDSLEPNLVRDSNNDDLEPGLIPDAIVEEIFSTCGCDTLLRGLVHGASRTKPAAARVVAALAGTSKGAAVLIGDSCEDSADIQSAFFSDGMGIINRDNVIKVLLDIANSGPNQAATVKSDCLRGLFRLMGGTEHPIQARCAMIEKAGGRAVFG